MEGSEVRRRGGGADEDEDAEPEELDRLIKKVVKLLLLYPMIQLNLLYYLHQQRIIIM